ncbi:MAG: hypothetical protein ACI9BF_000949 [Candidatus Paceibacteria bacterium]|jgi:hypothetical protein
MKNKKVILIVLSFMLVCLFLIFKNSVNLGLCQKIDYSCRMSLDEVERFLSPALILLFFSLLTYKLPQIVFDYWWKFARFGIPLVFALVILINLRLHHSPGGWLNLDNEIDLVLVGLIYGLFSLGSVIQIIRGYYKK